MITGSWFVDCQKIIQFFGNILQILLLIQKKWTFDDRFL